MPFSSGVTSIQRLAASIVRQSRPAIHRQVYEAAVSARSCVSSGLTAPNVALCRDGLRSACASAFDLSFAHRAKRFLPIAPSLGGGTYLRLARPQSSPLQRLRTTAHKRCHRYPYRYDSSHGTPPGTYLTLFKQLLSVLSPGFSERAPAICLGPASRRSVSSW